MTIKQLKLHLIFAIFLLLVSTIYAFIETSPDKIRSFIDGYFAVGLTFLVIGLFSYVINSGFFDTLANAGLSVLRAFFFPTRPQKNIFSAKKRTSVFAQLAIMHGIIAIAISAIIALKI